MSGDYDWGLTPRQANREIRRWTPVAITAVVASFGVITVAVVLMWQLHVWVFTRSVDLQNRTYQNSYGTQQADIGSMETAIQAITRAFTLAQERADALSACGYGAKVTQLPPGDAAWYESNCSGPALSPASQYEKNG